MKIQDYLDKDLLLKMIDLGYVLVNKHPDSDLYILCYSKICTLDWMWNDVTEKCRGLIIDSEGNIKARPFRKFYNFEEIENKDIIPNLPFEVFDKMDGSLGILYWNNGFPWIATKGSFTSDQAWIANKILHEKPREILSELNPNLTYLFEIITPEDPKVVNYGNLQDLFLIAVIDTETGEEHNIEDYDNLFRIVPSFKKITNWRILREVIDGTNREGFVIKFSNNFRLKLKYAEYFELHKILYSLSDNFIFDLIKDGKTDDLMVLKDKLPETQWDRIENIIKSYKKRFTELVIKSKAQYKIGFSTRKQAAEYFKTCEYPQVMFAMLDGRDITPFIWKIVAKERKNEN